MSSKGRNPFDRTTNLPKDSKPSKVGRQVVEWERIRAAQNVAGKQKARTEAALAAPVVVPPKVVPRPVKPVVVPPPEVPSQLNIKWTGMNTWRGVCFTMWVILSLAGFSGNFFGGLILCIGLFFIMVFISGMPFFLKGVTMNGGRNNNGKAV